MSLLGFLFGGDTKTTTTTSSNTNTTANVTDSYNSTTNQNLTKNTSYVNAPTTNTALDYVTTYNLADTGNINGASSGFAAQLGSVLDLNKFFAETQPKTPATSGFDWSAGTSQLQAIADIQRQTLQGQAKQTAAAGAANNPAGSALKWVAVAAIVGIVLLVIFRKK